MLSTLATHLRAVPAEELVTACAATRARVARRRVAEGAVRTATVTNLGLADLAVTAVVSGVRATSMAVDALPLLEARIRTVAVIGVEHLDNNLEEVDQASAAERLSQDMRGISLAQPIPAHVRMRDIGTALRTTRMKGLDRVG